VRRVVNLKMIESRNKSEIGCEEGEESVKVREVY
jgi:hypothetical protein